MCLATRVVVAVQHVYISTSWGHSTRNHETLHTHARARELHSLKCIMCVFMCGIYKEKSFTKRT